MKITTNLAPFEMEGTPCRVPKAGFSGHRRNSSKFPTSFLLLFAALLATSLFSYVDAQTFQYSRGWTNGKRSGVSSFDPENDRILLGSSPEAMAEVLPGHLALSLSPGARFRGGGSEYPQYLVKRSANLANKRVPMWIGTIVGMEEGQGQNQGQGQASQGSPITTGPRHGPSTAEFI